MPLDLTQARDHAVTAAVSAAHCIRRYAGRLRQETIRAKGTHDLVTHADEEAQRVIIDHLHRAYPDHDVLAEEGAAAEAGAAGAYRWIIDPIDGTTNFTRGIPPYAVSIGLQHGADLLVGVVLDVARGELFTAVRGGGLYVNGVPARVAETARLFDAALTTGFPYRAFDEADAYLTAMRAFMEQSLALRRPGAASVDLAYVACGRFDGFFEAGLRPWDVAAGTLLVLEGGGRVTDFAGGPADVLAPDHVLATNGRIHDEMLAVLRAAYGGARG